MKESKISFWKVRLTGYAWHYSNGVAFGIADAVLFGRGPWLFTIVFGLTLAFVFLTIIRFLIPPMRLGVKLPLVVLLAHLAVILVLIFVAHNLISTARDSQTFFNQFLNNAGPSL